jgi:hypothetical protein
MSKKLTIEEGKERLKKSWGDIVTLYESTYISLREMAKFNDKEYGDFEGTADAVFNKKCSHPKRKQEKYKKTCQERFGTNHPMQLEEFQQKSKKNNKYIVTIEEFKKRLFKIYGDGVVLDESTYINTKIKCRFIDKELGEFFKTPNNMICQKQGHPKRQQEKCRQTCMRIYGVDNPAKNKEVQEKMKQTCLKNNGCEYPAQNPEIALRQAKSQKNSGIMIHWKTGKEVVWTAGYEKALMYVFNRDLIDFEKDIPFYNEKDKYMYFVDFYLPDYDLYIETKGRKRERGMKKFEWFHKEHPNSELWDYKKLKRLGVIDSKGKIKK